MTHSDCRNCLLPSHASLSRRIGEDLRCFLDAIASDASYDPKTIQINLNASEVITRIKQAYVLEGAAGEGTEVRSEP
jgi:hypothetical protein